MSRAIEQELNLYERERLKRIQQNQQQMVQLGVVQAARAMQEVAVGCRPQAYQMQRRQRRTPATASRHSLRLKSLPAPNYSTGFTLALFEGEKNRRRVRLNRGGLSSLRGAHPNAVNWPSQDMVNKVIAQAEETIRQSEGPAHLKLMLPSHVSGGFWLQLPRDLTEFMPTTSSRVILDCDGEEWENVYLVRGHKSGGLSGGWRGFAIDQGLCVGDAVVFEKTAGHRLNVTIHRASPYGGYLDENILGSQEVKPQLPRRHYTIKRSVSYSSQSHTEEAHVSETVEVSQSRVLRQGRLTDSLSQKKVLRSSKKVKVGDSDTPSSRPKRKCVQPSDEEYVVECILDEKVKEDKRYFLIKWYSYDDSWNTWEPEEMLDCPPEDYPRKGEAVIKSRV